MTALLVVGPIAALLLVAGVLLARRDLSRRRAAKVGTTAYDVFLLGLPEVVGPARLRLGPTLIVVDEPETHRRFDLTGTGLTLAQQYGDWARGGDRERSATGRDGRGNLVEITGDQGDMVAIWQALHGCPLPAAPQPPASVPSRDSLFFSALIAAAGLMGLVVCVVLAGAASVVATVIEPGNGVDYCLVEWASPWSGEALRNGADCDDDVGEEVHLWALNTPFRGDVWDAETPWGLAGTGGVLAVLGLIMRGYSSWSDRRRARRAAAQTAEAAAMRQQAGTDDAGSVLPLSVDLPSADRLTYTTARSVLLEVVRARSLRPWPAQDVEAFRKEQRELARYRRGALGLLVRVGPMLMLPVVALVVGGLLAWTPLDSLLAGRGRSATVEAVVGDVYDGELFVWPDDVDLTFTTGTGQEIETVAAVVDGDALPSTVLVEYSVEKPFRASVVGDPGPVRGMALSGAGVLLALLIAVVPALVRWGRRRAALARADRGEPELMAYLLDRGPGPPGEVVAEPMGLVHLFDQRGEPTFQLLVVGEGVARAAVYGTARIRGELREEAPVRCTLGDVDVTCDGGLIYFDPQAWLDDVGSELGGEPVH